MSKSILVKIEAPDDYDDVCDDLIFVDFIETPKYEGWKLELLDVDAIESAECARSAKLIEALSEIASHDLDDETIGGMISDGCIARHAIAEYEASK